MGRGGEEGGIGRRRWRQRSATKGTSGESPLHPCHFQSNISVSVTPRAMPLCFQHLQNQHLHLSSTSMAMCPFGPSTTSAKSLHPQHHQNNVPMSPAPLEQHLRAPSMFLHFWSNAFVFPSPSEQHSCVPTTSRATLLCLCYLWSNSSLFPSYLEQCPCVPRTSRTTCPHVPSTSGAAPLHLYHLQSNTLMSPSPPEQYLCDPIPSQTTSFHPTTSRAARPCLSISISWNNEPLLLQHPSPSPSLTPKIQGKPVCALQCGTVQCDPPGQSCI